jgi:hypothetical protein
LDRINKSFFEFSLKDGIEDLKKRIFLEFSELNEMKIFIDPFAECIGTIMNSHTANIIDFFQDVEWFSLFYKIIKALVLDGLS